MPVVALPELIFYALMFFVLAFAFASKKMTQAILGPLASWISHLPWIGTEIAGLIKTAEQAISNACGSLENGVDQLMGAAWHSTARLMDWTWRELRSHATAIAAIATPFGTILSVIHGVRSLVHRLNAVAHVGASGVKRLEREWHGIERRVKTLEHEVAKGIGADVLPRIRSLDRELHNVESRTIPALEQAVSAAENDVTQLGQWVRAHLLSNTTDAIAAAVAVGLAALGLGGLRCNSLANSLKNRGCGFWSGLEDLLGLLGDVLLVSSLCELIPQLEAIYSLVAAPFVAAMNDAAELVCHASANASPPLRSPQTYLPANPGVTLHLP